MITNETTLYESNFNDKYKYSKKCPAFPGRYGRDNPATMRAKIMGPSAIEGPALYTIGFPGLIQ